MSAGISKGRCVMCGSVGIHHHGVPTGPLCQIGTVDKVFLKILEILSPLSVSNCILDEILLLVITLKEKDLTETSKFEE